MMMRPKLPTLLLLASTVSRVGNETPAIGTDSNSKGCAYAWRTPVASAAVVSSVAITNAVWMTEKGSGSGLALALALALALEALDADETLDALDTLELAEALESSLAAPELAEELEEPLWELLALELWELLVLELWELLVLDEPL